MADEHRADKKSGRRTANPGARSPLVPLAWAAWAFTVGSLPLFLLWFPALWRASPGLVFLYLAWTVDAGFVLLALVGAATGSDARHTNHAIGRALWPLAIPLAILWLVSVPIRKGRPANAPAGVHPVMGDLAAGAVDGFGTVVIFGFGVIAVPVLWVFVAVWAPLRLWRSRHPDAGPGGLQPPLPALTN